MKPKALLLLVLCTLAAATACEAAATYIGPKPFNSAIAGFGFKKVFNLDSFEPGTEIRSLGMVGIEGDGLQSDGTVQCTLSMVASSSYSPSSSPISIGVSGSGDQLLAGNSDRITFTFSRPLHAFGVYLIGNPSPTGEPAIPFWRMRVSNSSGYDAYSSTEPLITPGGGNDLYFLGVVSARDAFQRVDLYSDNDPAAVYSFNIDDVVIAADVPVLSLTEAKSAAPGDVVISDAVVTRVHSERFNVEASNRSAGMAVLGEGVSRGKSVSVFGSLSSTADDERVLELVQLISEQEAVAPAPLGIGGRSVGGGGNLGLQPGCTGSIGPNNIGLDVVVWGKVTAYDESIDRTWITIDDGSGRESGMGSPGIKIQGPAIWGNGRRVGEIVRVQGSSSLFKIGSDHYPLIRVAEYSDIQTLLWLSNTPLLNTQASAEENP